MTTWTITPADPPADGAELHLVLTPPEPVADLLELGPEARAAFWRALDQAACIAHQKGWPGYSWAVTEDRPGVVQVVAGGKAALDLTEHRETRLGPNDLAPCPSPSAVRRHLARAEHCAICGVEGAVPARADGGRVMSIYATTWSVADDDHDDGCARLVRVAGYDNVWEHDDTKPCTCQAGPLAYQGSHILPADDDERRGCVDLGAIPGFIYDKNRPAIGEDDTPYWPWLRLSVNEETVVLTRDQVAELHEQLGDWLMGSEGGQR